MIGPDIGPFDALLEIGAVLSKIMQQPGEIGRALKAEGPRHFLSKRCHRHQVLGQRLPVTRVAGRSGMRVVRHAKSSTLAFVSTRGMKGTEASQNRTHVSTPSASCCNY